MIRSRDLSEGKSLTVKKAAGQFSSAGSRFPPQVAVYHFTAKISCCRDATEDFLISVAVISIYPQQPGGGLCY